MAKLETFITISVFDDGTTVIKQSAFDDKGNNLGDKEIQARDVAGALNLKTVNDELADYVDEVVSGDGAGDAEPDDTDSPKPTAKKPARKRKGTK